MSTEEARRIVQDGLDQQRAQRNEREARLDEQERQLRLTINHNHTARTMTEAQKKAQEAEAAERKRAAREEARARDREREAIATLAVRRYIYACAGIVLATLLTPFPWWAAMTLTIGLAVFPTARVYRLYWMGV